MDEAEVERAVLLGWYWERLENCHLQNRFYAECIHAHPDRLSAFASVYPGQGGAGAVAALAELDWARENGLCGLGELSPHSVGWSVDDPILASILERAGDWGWPVNLHVTETDSRAYPGKVETPLGDFLKLAKAHPHTRFILAHWGAGLPFVVKTPLPQNLYFDTAASPLIYDTAVWAKFVESVGAERVLFGSDYPLNLYPAKNAQSEMRCFADELREESGLTTDEIRVIGSDNARSLLGLR